MRPVPHRPPVAARVPGLKPFKLIYFLNEPKLQEC